MERVAALTAYRLPQERAHALVYIYMYKAYKVYKPYKDGQAVIWHASCARAVPPRPSRHMAYFLRTRRAIDITRLAYSWEFLTNREGAGSPFRGTRCGQVSGRYVALPAPTSSEGPKALCNIRAGAGLSARDPKRYAISMPGEALRRSC